MIILIHQVLLEKKAKQDLMLVPPHIVRKFMGWVLYVESFGIREARLVKSFHDEPLKGSRKGQRSIRLNRSYRAIYIELSQNEIAIINVIEVNKHDYS
jgi:proteic killer suppression protein